MTADKVFRVNGVVSAQTTRIQQSFSGRKRKFLALPANPQVRERTRYIRSLSSQVSNKALPDILLSRWLATLSCHYLSSQDSSGGKKGTG